MNLRDIISGRRTESEYYKMKTELMESSGIPIPDAMIKISNMIKRFDYSVNEAECIEKYTTLYIKRARFEPSAILSILNEITSFMEMVQQDPAHEGRIALSVNEDGVTGGVYFD